MTVINNKKQLTVYLILLVAIIIISNIVSRSLFFRFDLTDNKMYSLSNSSKQIIRKLDDRIIAKVYFSKDIPGQLANSRRYLQDLLEEYEAYSRGHFHFEFITPDNDKKIQEEAHDYGIFPLQAQVVENDKLEIKNIYMGLVFLYNGKQEVIQAIQTTEGLEYILTAAIKKITATDLKTVGLVSRENKAFSTARLDQNLSQTYTIRNLSLNHPIAADIQTLLMHGIDDTLSSEQFYNLDQFLMRGGQLFIGAGYVIAQLQEGLGYLNKSNLFNFLEHHGLRINRDLVIDQVCGQVQVQQRHGFFNIATAANYPPFVTIQKFDKENLIVRGLEQVRLFFLNEITPSDSSLHFTPLLQTSDKTGTVAISGIPRQGMLGRYSVIEGYNLTPHIRDSQYSNPAMTLFPHGPKTVAAMVEGDFRSYFAGNDLYNTKPGFRARSIGNTRILLVTDNELFNDTRAGGIPENIDFMLNSIDYLSGDKELIEIRSRTVTARPLDKLSDGKRQFWKWLNIVLPALSVILLGIYRWKRDLDKRKLLEGIYG